MFQRTVRVVVVQAAGLSLGLAALLSGTALAQAPVINKANNAGALNLGTSWVGGVAPVGTDIAQWEATVTGANSTVLGADQSWLGIKILNPGGAVTIGGGNLLTLGASGVDMSAATQNLALNANVDLGAAQTWRVATGRTLTVGGVIGDSLLTGSALTKLSGGTLTLTRSNTYAGATNLLGGVTNLNFSPATTTDIVGASSPVTIGNTALNVNGAAGGTNSQSFISTALSAGLSSVNVANGSGGGSMTLNLGTVTTQIGGVLRFSGPATQDGLSNPVAATGTITAGTIAAEANGILGGYTGINVASAGYATVGLYDFAATSGGTIIGVSQSGGYTPLTAGLPNGFGTPANYDLQANITNSAAGSQKNAGAVRFNTPGANTITSGANNLFTATAMLITPNMGTENTQLTGAGSFQVIRQTNPNGPQQGTIWQNNTQAFFTVGIPIIDGREGTGDPTHMVKAGAGTAVFSGVNTYTGGTHVYEGALMVTADANLGAAAAPVFLGGGTLVANASIATGATRNITLRNIGGGLAATAGNTLTINGVIADSANPGGALTVGIPASAANGNVANLVAGTGAGTGNATPLNATGRVVLANANTYTGGTNIIGGTLLATNTTGSATGTGNVTVGNGGGLGGSGIVTGAVAAASGGRITPGVAGVNAGIGTLSLGSLNLAAGSILDFDMAAAQNDMLTLAGTLTFGGAAQVNLFQAGTSGQFMLNGTYNMFTVNGGPPTLGQLTSNLTIANPVGGGSYTWGVNGNLVTLTIGGLSSASVWNVNGGGVWGTASNWSPQSAPTNAGDSATFGNVLTTGTASIQLQQVRTVGNLSFNNTNGASYSIDPAGGSLALNNGASTAALSVVAGNHSITAPIALGSNTNVTVSQAANTLTISGSISGARNMRFMGAGRTVLSGTNSYIDTQIDSGATVQVGTGGAAGTIGSGSVTLDGTLEVNRNNAVSVNAITGAGTLVNSGAGTTTLSAVNNGAFNVTANAGKIVVGSGSNLGTGAVTTNGGTVDVNGTSPTVSSLAGAGGAVDNSNAATVVLTVNQAGNSTFAGSLTDTGGNMQLVKTGAGTLTLSGLTAIDGGTTSYNAGAILVDSSVRVDAGSVLLVGNSSLPAGKVLESRVSGAGVLLGNANVGGTILLHPNANSAQGLLDVTAGSSATISGTLTVPPTMTNATQIRVNAGNDASTSLTITGTMSIVNASIGIFMFERGNVTFAGNSTTTIGPDIWFGRNGGSNPTFTIRDNAHVTGNANLILAAGGATTASATLTLQDNAVLTSTLGNFELNGQSTTGTTLNLNGGSLNLVSFSKTGTTQTNVNFRGTQINIANFGSLMATPAGGATNLFVGAGGAKINTAGFDTVIDLPLEHEAALLTRDGGLTKSGAGRLTLSGANSYTGHTRVTEGSLALAQATLDDLADVFISGGGTLELNFGGQDIIRSLFVNNVPQPVGIYGPIGSGVQFERAYLSGFGALQVSALGVISADFDGNGIVDGNDFILIQRQAPTAANFAAWRNQFGGPPPSLGAAGAVPEPGSCLLAGLALAAISGTVRRRQR
jgi:autotransporter-associated beta strand protein